VNANYLLIFDKRKEISNKYKKILEQNHLTSVVITSEEEVFDNNLLNIEPELILISDSITDDIPKLCKKIREKRLNFRPIIIVLSKSSYLEDRSNALNAGADDFLSEPIDNEEFCARMNAHLRRTQEENSCILTKLPNENYSKKIIKRTLLKHKEWSMLLIGINYLNFYREIYGDIPAEKLLQAYSAILLATIEYDDYVGHIDNDKFLIITSSYKAEKLADYLNYAFDSISSKFYCKDDVEKGYIMMQGDNKAGCKIPLVTTSIGIIDSTVITYSNEKEVINSLNNVQKLAKTVSGSSKVIDRPRIKSDDLHNIINRKNIIVIEKDADLSYLLETTLKLQGFTPKCYDNYNIDIDEILNYSPSLIIIDKISDNDDESDFELAKRIKLATSNNIKIVFTDSTYQKEKILNAGADLYMPKPYDLMELFQWIYKLLDI